MLSFLNQIKASGNIMSYKMVCLPWEYGWTDISFKGAYVFKESILLLSFKRCCDVDTLNMENIVWKLKPVPTHCLFKCTGRRDLALRTPPFKFPVCAFSLQASSNIILQLYMLLKNEQGICLSGTSVLNEDTLSLKMCCELCSAKLLAKIYDGLLWERCTCRSILSYLAIVKQSTLT